MKLTTDEPKTLRKPKRQGPLCVRGHVIVAESSDGARRGMAKALLAEGFEVVECTDGSDVVTLAKAHQPDVLFLDAGMKRADAYETVRILERFEGTRSVVVILTCPPDFDETRLERLESTGAMLVLVKPLTRDGLLHAFRQALAESHERKAQYEAPAERKTGNTRRVEGNNSLLVRRLLCPFHETPVEVDRFTLRNGKIQTDTSFFDLPVYTSAVAGADYVDYHLVGVAVCPRCGFASNNPGYFTDPDGRQDENTRHHTPATKSAVAKAAGARLKLAGTPAPDFFTWRRNRAGAILSYELAIHSGKTLLECSPHAHEIELLRLGNYHLRLAYLHGVARSPDEVKAKHFTAAYGWLQRAFTVLDGPELHKTIYQLVALAISLGEDRTAYQYLTKLSQLSQQPLKKGQNRGSIERYLTRCQLAWEDRADHRFPWVETTESSDGALANAA